MPSIKWHEVFKNPIVTLKILLVATAYSTKAIIARLLWPFGKRVIPLRTALARIWVGKAFQYNHLILYSAPKKWQGSAQIIHTPGGFTGYLIPSGSADTDVVAKLKDADAVIVFAHGGGYIMGHALQYLREYARWVAKAKKMGKKVVVVTVDYPLSVEKKWPAQRDAFLAFYCWILEQGVPSSKVVFGGDSAGGNLAVASMLYLRDHQTSPQPSCAALISPWLDLSGSETRGSPRVANDFILKYDDILPVMNDTLRPTNLPFDTPEISPVLVKDVSRLPPQLVFYGDTELLGTDSIRWIERSRAAGVEVKVHAGRGQMHTYALGWPVGSSAIAKECDQLLMDFIFGHVA